MNGDVAPPQTPYRFSNEEMRVLQQCNSESFFQRSLPLGTLLGVGTYYGVKAGFLQSNNKFGAVPKVVAAVICGYIIGKVSYQTKCAEKLMALPDSKLGAMLRNRKRKGGMQEAISLDAPGIDKAFSEMPSSETYSDMPPSTYMDLDTDRPMSSDIDDTFRSLASSGPLDDDILPLSPQRTTTYDDLRRKNREEYELKRTKPYRGVLTPDDVPSELKSREPEKANTEKWNKATNRYGDTWDK